MRIEKDALEHMVAATQGYPYFLQEWGKHAWDVADESPITLRDVRLGSDLTIAALRDYSYASIPEMAAELVQTATDSHRILAERGR